MKKAYFLAVFLYCLLTFAACGKKEEETVYYDIRVESSFLEGAKEGQWLMGRQYYQGETVCILCERVSADGGSQTMDVYIQPAGKEKQKLMSGVSTAYRSSWYLDGNGNVFAPQQDGVIRLDEA